MIITKNVNMTVGELCQAVRSYLNFKGLKIDQDIHLVFKNGKVIEEMLFTSVDVSWKVEFNDKMNVK